MLRRLILAGLAAGLVAPLYVTTPASAAILFTCSGIDPDLSYFTFDPGLGHNQTAQDSPDSVVQNSTPCSNGALFVLAAGTDWTVNAVTTYGPRPLGCPVAWGGAGPDYADQTPILLGATDPSFAAFWYPSMGTSTGIVKVKQGAAGDQWRLIYNITAGEGAPPAGKKTKIKFTANIAPSDGETYTCADDTDPVALVSLTSVGQVIVNQK
jgi:hypothetical protein